MIYDSSRDQPILSPVIWQDSIISWGLRIKDKPIKWLKQGQGVKQFTLPPKLLEEIQQKIERENGVELQIVAELWIPNSYIIRSSCNLDPETISQVFSEYGPIDHVEEEGTVETPGPTESSGTPVTEKPKQGQSQSGKATPATKTGKPETETEEKPETETPVPPTEKPTTKTGKPEKETRKKSTTETKLSEKKSGSVSLTRVKVEGNKIEQVRLLNGSQIHEKDQLQFYIDFIDETTTLENFLKDQENDITLLFDKKEWKYFRYRGNQMQFNCQLLPGKHTLKLIIAEGIFKTDLTVISQPRVTLTRVKGNGNKIKQVQLLNGSKIYQDEQLHFRIDLIDAKTTLEDFSKEGFGITIKIFYGQGKLRYRSNNEDVLRIANQIHSKFPTNLNPGKYDLKLLIAEDTYEIPINVISPPLPNYPQ